LKYVRFKGFTKITMKNAVLWDVAPCRSCVNRRFGGTWMWYVPPKRRFTQDLQAPHPRRRHSSFLYWFKGPNSRNRLLIGRQVRSERRMERRATLYSAQKYEIHFLRHCFRNCFWCPSVSNKMQLLDSIGSP
jgi:hypothetical protein